MNEPYPPSTVKKLLVAILKDGVLAFTNHAYEEMAKDNLTEVDVRNTLRGGTPQAGEYVSDSWRYRVTTFRVAVVVAFRSTVHAVVVTAWRTK